jgi:hypothetical protein
MAALRLGGPEAPAWSVLSRWGSAMESRHRDPTRMARGSRDGWDAVRPDGGEWRWSAAGERGWAGRRPEVWPRPQPISRAPAGRRPSSRPPPRRSGPGRGMAWVVADLFLPDEALRLAREAPANLGRIGILVNSAGSDDPQLVEQVRDEDRDRPVGLNLGPGLASSRAPAPAMRATGRGRIIQIGSVLGFFGTAGRAACSATNYPPPAHPWPTCRPPGSPRSRRPPSPRRASSVAGPTPPCSWPARPVVRWPARSWSSTAGFLRGRDVVAT